MALEDNKTDKKKGLLISFDGLDSSGKATQSKNMVKRLRYLGWKVHTFQSPDYDTGSGRELKLRLQNKIGNWQETSWEQKMHFFADNRTEHRDEVSQALGKGEIVIYDRYVPSSLAFITVEALESQETELRREKVYETVSRYEYQNNKMPVEDVSVWLDVPPKIAGVLLEKRKKDHNEDDEYTDHIKVQERLYNEYDYMVKKDPARWLRINCVEGDEILGINDVTELIWSGLLAKFPFLEHPNK